MEKNRIEESFYMEDASCAAMTGENESEI